MPAKNIVFDLGGVIIDLHIHKTREAFETLGIADIRNWFVMSGQAVLLNQYETGKMSTESFIEALNQENGLHISEEDFYDAWSAMLGKVKPERIDMLRQLKDDYRIYALSNINPLHAHACHQMLQRDHGIFSFHELFDRVFYSHEMGARKPERRAWEIVAETTGLQPSETLFFDDNKENVEMALTMGFDAHLVDREISELLPRILRA